jgi:hypothetical protein
MSGFGKSSSSSQANSTSTTQNTSVPINVQPGGNGGVSQGYTSAGGDVNTSATTYDISTDSGAIQSNADVAKHTVDAATSLNQESSALVKSIAQNAFDFASSQSDTLASTISTSNEDSLSFAGRSLNSVDAALSGALNGVTDAYSSAAKIQGAALDSATSANTTAFEDLAAGFKSALSTVADSTNSALSTAAASTSSTYASTETVKYVLYGLGAVAVAIAAIVILGRKS